MYGSYAEAYAYDQDSEEDSFLRPFLSSQDDGMPPEVGCSTQQQAHANCTNRGGPTTTEDFILVAEFSEIEGPQPLFTIPNEAEVGFDLNDYAVRLLSVDHQVTSSGSFSISDDTQVLMSDPITGIQSYVHYFTLYDISARGYVRPMCVAYVTHDKKKMLDNFSNLRSKFLEVIRIMKYSNRGSFLKEAKQHLKNLEFTKERYLNWKQADISKIATITMSPTEVRELKGVSLDMLASSIGEIQHVVHSVTSVLDDKKIEEVLLFTEKKVRSSSSASIVQHICPYINGTWLPTKQSIVRMSRRFDRHMKTLSELCKWGFVLGISLLSRIHKFYRRDTLTLYMERQNFHLAEPPLGILSLNGCLVTNVLQEIPPICSTASEGEASPEHNLLLDKCADLLLNLSELTPLLMAPDKSNISVVTERSEDDEDSIEFCVEIPACAAQFKVGEAVSVDDNAGDSDGSNAADIELPCSGSEGKSATQVSSIVCHIETLTPDKPGYGIAQVFQKYNCCMHVLYSLLVGRPLVILGSASSEDEVRSIVQAFALFLPEKSGRDAVMPWSHNTLKLKDLTKLRLIGMCARQKRSKEAVPSSVKQYVSVLDVDNMLYQGPLYTGSAFSQLSQSCSSLTEDVLLVSHVFSLLTAVASKVYLYYHCSCITPSETSTPSQETKPSPVTLLKNLNVSKQDVTIIKHLVEMIKEKQMADSSTSDDKDALSAPVLKVVHEQLSVISIASQAPI